MQFPPLQVTLDDLRARIPPVNCIEGCADCCGLAFMSAMERARITGTKQRQPDAMDCQYLDGHRCSIYAERPMICRLFGTTDMGDLACPHGARPDNPLSESEGQALMDEYVDLAGNWLAHSTIGEAISVANKDG